MSVKSDIRDFLKESGRLFLPSLSVDCVVFGFHNNELKVLLLKNRHDKSWALPGGFILRKEHTEMAAHRILKERTGLDEIFLQQFYLFGDPDRSDKAFHRKKLRKEGIEIDLNHWILQRFVTIGFYALVEFSLVKPVPDSMSEECTWCDISDIPPLMMDHRKILDKALETLRGQLNHQPIGYKLLPEKFTMPELQRLYETILGKKLDRRNFQRRILGYQIVRRLKETKQGGAHKAAYLYSFDIKKYHRALKEGLSGGW